MKFLEIYEKNRTIKLFVPPFNIMKTSKNQVESTKKSISQKNNSVQKKPTKLRFGLHVICGYNVFILAFILPKRFRLTHNLIIILGLRKK